MIKDQKYNVHVQPTNLKDEYVDDRKKKERWICEVEIFVFRLNMCVCVCLYLNTMKWAETKLVYKTKENTILVYNISDSW